MLETTNYEEKKHSLSNICSNAMNGMFIECLHKLNSDAISIGELISFKDLVHRTTQTDSYPTLLEQIEDRLVYLKSHPEAESQAIQKSRTFSAELLAADAADQKDEDQCSEPEAQEVLVTDEDQDAQDSSSDEDILCQLDEMTDTKNAQEDDLSFDEDDESETLSSSDDDMSEQDA